MKTTTLFTVLALAGTLSLSAQPAGRRTTKAKGVFGFVAKKSTQEQAQPGHCASRTKAPLKASAAPAAPIWCAATIAEEIYDGEWLPMSVTTSTYNTAGLPLVEIHDEDGLLFRTTYRYDANNQELEVIEETNEEGEGYYNSARKTYEYDTVVKDFRTATTNYVWDDVESAWTEQGNIWKRSVNRNNQGNVTDITVSVPYQGSMMPTEKTTITYDATTQKADTWSFQQYDSYLEEWGAPLTYSDIVWENTNGQLVLSSEQFVLGDNRLKSAMITDEGEDIGLLQVTYAAGKRDFDARLIYSDGTGYETHKLTTLDENGSYREEMGSYDETGAEIGFEYVIEKYDAQSNPVLYEEYFSEEGGEPELMGGTKVEYTYDEQNRLLTETQYEWTPTYDDDDNMTGGSYEPMVRRVYSDYKDVTTGIVPPVAQQSAGIAVYSLQGVAVGTDTKKLPAGIYLVKSGNKVTKMLKK